MIETPLRKEGNKNQFVSFNIPTPFPIGPVHSYLLFGDRITLVDAGPKTEKAWKSLVYQLNLNGIRIKDIDQVVLTHYHVDHSGLLSVIKEHHPKIRILAHPLSIPAIEKKEAYINDRINFFEELYKVNGLSWPQIEGIKKFYEELEQFADPVVVDGKLTDGMNLFGNKAWKIIHSPGHSQGHIMLYHEKDHLLIAGDHLIGHTSAGSFIEPPYEKGTRRPKSVVQYQKSLNSLKELQISYVYSGHGEIMDEPYEVINKELKRFEHRAYQIANLLLEKPLSVYELMQAMYPKRYDKHLALYFSEVLGHLDLLEHQGVVGQNKEKHIIKYFLSK